MKSLLKDEQADSMIIFVLASGVLVFGLAYIVLTYSLNVPIGAINTMIDSGTISVDTSNHLSTMLDMWKASPYFFIIGLLLFCFERAKGESVTSDAFFGYLVLMIITLVISAYLVWGFGMSLDAFTVAFENNHDLMDYGAEWDVTAARSVCIAGMYYAAMFPGFLGSLLYMLHPIMKQRENSFLRDDENGGEGQEYITNYSMEQM